MNLLLSDPAFLSVASAVSGGGGGTPWTPAATTTLLWLDAADASTITESSGNIIQWNDKSGNSRNATQAVAADQPTYITGGLNGLNTIRCNGNWINVAPFSSGTYTWLTVTTARLAAANTSVFGNQSGTAGTSSICPIGSSNSTLTSIIRVAGVDNPAGAIQLFDGETTQTVVTRGDIYNKFNSNLIYCAQGIPALVTTISLGAASFGYILPSDLAEVIVFSGTPALTDRQKAEGYLAHKWGLTANLPTSHPYKSAAPTV